ncbi:MotA/TolQ/ExbB proton channel family protein [Rhodopirellula sp. SWK7]|uniref:MotA/TolQ/ExbB proton channel family protein n=1 Tax=Rhodopirellula sp. SWK7 TaxID=595460 RepID=UPI0002BD50AD|nr:MotA/TolQ/ExbB proton channel family protein [Rhodopirellula sp. SWK7]EMI47258.1 MotA/TolQ/ExbB proton channel [Rhodopirellula sp. SWK7]
MLELISSYSTLAILAAAAVHVLAFVVLTLWAKSDRKRIAQTLERFTAGLPHRSRMDFHVHLSDQIDAFLADIGDVMAQPYNSPDRVRLADRIRIIDERRDYLHSLRFETAWNVARTMIEAYPLAGVLGTILAIGSALAADDQASVNIIVTRFGDAIWSTFAGLSAAIVLMLIGSVVEPGFARLSENRLGVREMASKVKRELSINEQSGNGPSDNEQRGDEQTANEIKSSDPSNPNTASDQPTDASA